MLGWLTVVERECCGLIWKKEIWYIQGLSAFRSGLRTINNYLCFHTGLRKTFVPWFL